jgi:uroporphyrinogen-III synthase
VTRPLAGKLVLVTRTADRSERLVRLLERRGARPVLAPSIELVPARSAALTVALGLLAAGEFEWIVVTSQATVEMLAERLPSPRDVRANVAVIGEGSGEAWWRWSRRPPELQPKTFTTAALGRAFPRGSGRVLCARADIAPEGLEIALAEKGWEPTRVDAYRTRFPRSLPRDARDALGSGEVDAITFTSASTVRGFIGAVGTVKGNPKVVCIGPVTSREARVRGLRVAAVAKPHTMEGLVAALERVFTPRRTARR